MTIESTKKEEVILFRYQASSISPTRSINPKDLGLLKSDLPKELHEMLQHSVISEEELRPFSKYAKRVADRLNAVAFQNKLGYVVPPDQALDLQKLAEECVEGVNDARQTLIDRLPELSQAVIDKIEGYSLDPVVKDRLKEEVRRVQPTTAYLERQIGFTYQFFKAASVGHHDPSVQQALDQGLQAVMGGLWGDLLLEVVRAANEIRTDLGKNKQRDKVQQTTVNRVREGLVDKLDGLAFIDRRVRPLVTAVKAAVAEFPKQGVLKGSDYKDFMALLKVLSDQTHIPTCVESGTPLFVRKPTPAQPANTAVPVQAPVPTPAVVTEAETPEDELGIVPTPPLAPSAPVRPTRVRSFSW